ncbi:MAG: DUF4097 family beta strand repeat-containing protein, partial [Bacilli bacterium]
MKKIGLALVFIPLISSCTYTSNNMVNNSWFADADKYTVGSFSISFENISKIEINWIAGSLKIQKSEDGKISGSENGTDLLPDESLRYYVNEGTLLIQFCQSLYNKPIDFKKKQANVFLPDGLRWDMNSVSSSFSSDDGIVCTKAAFDSVSGDVDVSNLDCPEVKLDTVSGSVDLGLTPSMKDISVSTVSGDVDLGLNSQTMAVSFSTVSGSFSSECEYSMTNGKYVFGNDECEAEVDTV